jgi:hypothetical protein
MFIADSIAVNQEFKSFPIFNFKMAIGIILRNEERKEKYVFTNQKDM